MTNTQPKDPPRMGPRLDVVEADSLGPGFSELIESLDVLFEGGCEEAR